MILYHGSNVEIKNIDLSKSRPFKDFGKGFYATPILEHAKNMAKRVVKIDGGTQVVTKFELTDIIPADFSVKKFDQPDIKWAHFVMNNRNKLFEPKNSSECNFDNKYDIVIGPVANDKMANLFRQFEKSYIDEKMLLSQLEFREFTLQYSFHTEKAKSLLKVIGAING